MKKKLLPIFIIIIVATFIITSGLYKYFNFNELRKNYNFLQNYVQKNYILALSVYSIIYIFIVALSIPIATFMTVTSGVLFGQISGTICTVISATIGATMLFLSVRMASEEILTKRAGSWLDKMQKGFQENSFTYLLTLRIIPLFPFVAINLVSAVLQITIKTFFFATLIGIIPGTFVYVSLGEAIKEVIMQEDVSASIIMNHKILIALTGLGILILLPVIYRKISNK